MPGDDFRIEHDSLGDVRVPREALYGAQTQRALQNFPISGIRFPRPFLRALGLIKAAAAAVNGELGLLEPALANAIEASAKEVAGGQHDEQFPLDIFQTGSGTSTNMNANEVIAHLAAARSGGPVHPNDHVNLCQSSNDVIPSAIHLSGYEEVSAGLLPSLDQLRRSIDAKAASVDHVVKTGRTHLMDAVPIRLSQELSGWSHQIAQDSERLQSTLPRLAVLAIGATAVGTSLNAHPEFGRRVASRLKAETGHPFVCSANYFASLSSQDTAVELSGQLRTLAVSLMKISNDLRWMNSGPTAGLSEIALPALQPGSSIMPGKVNPVVPEAVAMVCAQVIGNDVAVAVAGQSGNFQLNVMLPVIAHNLLLSITILSNAARLLAEKAIDGLEVSESEISDRLERNPILATALAPEIGYEKAAQVAVKAAEEHRKVKDVAEEMTEMRRDELDRLLDPKRMTDGSEGAG
jgi:fumarate hydratase class II